jgi:NAD(P)H dehydrogenase (quinone)
MERQAREDGVPEPFPVLMTRHLKAIRLGYFDSLTDHVEKLTGRPPRPLRDVLVEHKGQLTALVEQSASV